MATGDTGSNADGIGARVFVEFLNPDGTKSKQVQELSGSTTFLSMNSLELTFGLGDAVSVENGSTSSGRAASTKWLKTSL